MPNPAAQILSDASAGLRGIVKKTGEGLGQAAKDIAGDLSETVMPTAGEQGSLSASVDDDQQIQAAKAREEREKRVRLQQLQGELAEFQAKKRQEMAQQVEYARQVRQNQLAYKQQVEQQKKQGWLARMTRGKGTGEQPRDAKN
jgi:hypothetical protein